jgi:hypothetical protein
MAKKRKGFHRIIIHPNRYLIWALAIMLIVAAALVSYIYITNINFDRDLSSGTDLKYWHTYKDVDMTLRYPADWLIDAGTGYIGFGTSNSDVFLVYSYSPPNDPAYDSYSKLANVQKITVDGLAGIRVPDQKNPNQRIVFVKTSKKLYEFRGSTGLFDQILNTVHFLKK